LSHDPDQWQRYIIDLLYAHHGSSEFIPIPDKTQGDGGIEGYSKCGKVYQCYAPESPVSEADRTQKIKSKINDDLNKFKSNKEVLTKLLGQTVVTRWILITPEYNDKSLVAYGHQKAEEIKREKLPYVSLVDFDVLVQDDNAYPVAKRNVSGSHIATLLNWEAGSQPTSDIISSWTQGNQGIIEVIERKLEKLSSISPQEKLDARDQFIMWTIQGGNLIEKLRTHVAESYQSILSTSMQLEARMRVSGTGSISDRSKISALIGSLEQELQKRLPLIPVDIVADISHAIISEWLTKCALNFRAVP